MEQQDVTFESSFTELFCISKLCLSSSSVSIFSSYCHFILLYYCSSILIYSKVLFFCLASGSACLNCSRLSQCPFSRWAGRRPAEDRGHPADGEQPFLKIFGKITSIFSIFQCVSILHCRSCRRFVCACVQADCPKAECFESLSAMELAEQITLLDHIVFRSIPYESVRPPAASGRCSLLHSHFVLNAITENKDNQVHHGFFFKLWISIIL